MAACRPGLRLRALAPFAALALLLLVCSDQQAGAHDLGSEPRAMPWGQPGASGGAGRALAGIAWNPRQAVPRGWQAANTCYVLVRKTAASSTRGAVNLAEIAIFGSNGVKVPTASLVAIASSVWSASANVQTRNCADGNTNNFCATANEADPWVAVAYPCSAGLTRVLVTNRKDCCSERVLPLSVSFPSASSAQRAPAVKFAEFASVALPEYNFYIQGACFFSLGLTSPSTNAYLSLASIRLFSLATNATSGEPMVGPPILASELSTWMSSVLSTANAAPACVADDNPATFCSTNNGDPNPQLRIAYPCSAGLSRVDIINRQGAPALQARLALFSARWGALNEPTCPSTPLAPAAADYTLHPGCAGSPDVSRVANATWDFPAAFAHGDSTTGTCGVGFAGAPTATCLFGAFTVSGGCTQQATPCLGVPGGAQPAHGAWNCTGTGTPDGGVCVAQCEDGFKGAPTASCDGAGYSNVTGSCEATDCAGAPPTTPDHATWLCASAPDGGNCSAACSQGYAGNVSAACSDGSWSAPAGACLPLPCTGVPGGAQPADGVWSCGASTPHGAACQATCTSPYAGNVSAACDLGTWGPVNGSCTIPVCGIGNFKNDTGCWPCPAGWTSTGVDAASCTVCALGYYYTASTPPRCTTCQSGRYGGGGTTTACTVCPTGMKSKGALGQAKTVGDCHALTQAFTGSGFLSSVGLPRTTGMYSPTPTGANTLLALPTNATECSKSCYEAFCMLWAWDQRIATEDKCKLWYETAPSSSGFYAALKITDGNPGAFQWFNLYQNQSVGEPMDALLAPKVGVPFADCAAACTANANCWAVMAELKTGAVSTTDLTTQTWDCSFRQPVETPLAQSGFQIYGTGTAQDRINGIMTKTLATPMAFTDLWDIPSLPCVPVSDNASAPGFKVVVGWDSSSAIYLDPARTSPGDLKVGDLAQSNATLFTTMAAKAGDCESRPNCVATNKGGWMKTAMPPPATPSNANCSWSKVSTSTFYIRCF